MKKVIKNNNVIAVVAMVVLAVALLATGVVASDPPDVGDPPVASTINYQGQLTDSGGNPLNGTYDIEFRFYDAAVGGNQVESTISKSNVQVTNGLFNVKLDVDQSDFNGQGLWLQLRVRSSGGSWDPWMTPRQEILPVPYALSLKPGAVIGGASAGDGSIYLKDAYDETVVEIRADRAYLDIGGPGNEGDIWVRDYNDEGVFTVDGNTALVEIGGPGNEGDICVKNAADETTFDVSGDTGRIKSGAESYIFISGNTFIKESDADSTRWTCLPNGGVLLRRGATTGFKTIHIPITLPSVLYGQNVKVEELTIYYACQDGTKNYITTTYLLSPVYDAMSYILVEDYTDRTGGSESSYTLPVTKNNVLSSDYGILGLKLILRFVDDMNYILISGVRLRVSHGE